MQPCENKSHRSRNKGPDSQKRYADLTAVQSVPNFGNDPQKAFSKVRQKI